MNSSFELNKYVVLRAAYARTIGRPELTEMVPGSQVTEPGAEGNTSRRITVNNTGLKPWLANNFDLTAESYQWKGATFSVSLFHKDVKDFFAQSITPATRAAVEALGITWEELYSTYDIVTKRNAGSARLNGIELSYRQQLVFLPGWGKRFQVYANYTSIDVSGPDANAFSFSPERSNWGIGYFGKKLIVNLNGAEGKPIREGAVTASATTPAGSYNYLSEYPRYDFSCEYNFTRRFGLYTSIRNLTSTPQKRMTYDPSLPGYAHARQHLFGGSMIAFGVKGEW